MTISKRSISVLLLTAVLLVPSLVSAKAAEQPASVDYFAVVDGEKISKDDFRMAYRAGVRKRFYHGKIPQKQLDDFKQEISDTLINRVLLVQEAKRRGISYDKTAVQEQLDGYEKRYSSRPDWKQYRETILKGLRAALIEEDLLKQLEKSVRTVKLPEQQSVRSFYEKRKDLFTTPEQSRVSLILLSVAPSSGADVWQAAQQEAQEVVTRLRKGADFSELARIHSGDPSAAQGGDMGFLHQGMLAPQAEKIISKLKPGEISEPVILLRGVAVFRLDEKRQATLNAFAEVKDRAAQLLQRELSNQAWTNLLRDLKNKADITIDMAGL